MFPSFFSTQDMTSDNYAVSTQAQALACLIALDQYPVPAPLRLFDSTPELVREFSALAFGGATPVQLQELASRYSALEDKPTLHADLFQAIMAFCRAGASRLEAAGAHLARARLAREQAPPHHFRLYRHSTLRQLLTAADELSCA
jgi:hypothetical protein